MKTDNNYEHRVYLVKKAFTIFDDNDIVKARQFARELSEQIGFSTSQRTLIATAVSEMCRNIIEHAGDGEILFEFIHEPEMGIKITITDNGPGISDINQAMLDGFTTGCGLGIGLPGTKRIMDQFDITSNSTDGTTVVLLKWLH